MKALQPNVHPVAGGLELEVADVRPQTDSIVSIAFRDPSGKPLPPYVPGSHLVVQYEGARTPIRSPVQGAPRPNTPSRSCESKTAPVGLWPCIGSRSETGYMLHVLAVPLPPHQRPRITCFSRQESVSRRCCHTPGTLPNGASARPWFTRTGPMRGLMWKKRKNYSDRP